MESTLASATEPVLVSVEISAGAGQLAVALNGALAATFVGSNVILRVDPTFSRVPVGEEDPGHYGS